MHGLAFSGQPWHVCLSAAPVRAVATALCPRLSPPRAAAAAEGRQAGKVAPPRSPPASPAQRERRVGSTPQARVGPRRSAVAAPASATRAETGVASESPHVPENACEAADAGVDEDRYVDGDADADNGAEAEATAVADRSDMDAMWEKWYAVLAELSRAQGGPGSALRVVGPRAEHLEDFIAYNRRMFKRKALSDQRMRRLDEISFEWSASEAVWAAHLEELALWFAEHGTFVIPKGENPALAQWARNQRSRHARGLLSALRATRLEEIGFHFAPVNGDRWNERFAELASFHKDHGHFRVLTVPSTKNRSLGRWLRHQRQLHKERALQLDRLRKLDGLGALSNEMDVVWNSNLRRLLKFKDENGHTEVPQVTKLGRWVHKQRSQYSAGKLASERQRFLEDIDFSWNVREKKWDRQFQSLSKYYDASSPELRGKKPEGDPPLSKWLENQRTAFLCGRLSAARMEKLGSIGILLSNSIESSELIVNDVGKAGH